MNDLFTHPPHSGSPTSREAALAIRPHAGTLRARVLEVIEGRGAIGATDDEIQTHLSIFSHTETPRRQELQKAGLIACSKQQPRRTRSGRRAVVWVSIEFAKLEA
jgi:hypothetical protein